MDLETGLNVVANRIKSGYDGVDKNNEVLYKLAITYFDELKDYKTATKYFNMVDSKDDNYGELADYYGAVSLIRSSTNPDIDELMEEVNGLAAYNQSQYTNQEVNKFVNYKIIGEIYATYIKTDDVATKAEEIMTQAIDDLEEYTGNDIDTNDYFYSYYDNLITIYEQLAVCETDELLRNQHYTDVTSYCDEYLNILAIKVEENGKVGIGGDNDNIYNTAYYNVMLKKAECYEAMGNFELAISQYEKLKEALGKENVLSNKVYAEYLDYVYSECSKVNADPTKWYKETPDKLEMLLNIYDAGQDVPGISNNKTWKKRNDILELLKTGDYIETETTDTDSTKTSEDEMGE